MSEIDVSIIIINWNTKEYLLSCLKSIYNTTKKCRFEIIVVDNASSDGSQKAARNQFPNVKLIQCEKNHGFAKANNIGIQKSIGSYICLINSDVNVLANCIDNLWIYIKENQSIGLAAPKLLNEDLSIQVNWDQFATNKIIFLRAIFYSRIMSRLGLVKNKTSPYNLNTIYIKKVDLLSGAFLMARRKAIDDVGVLDERYFFYCEDFDWCKRFWDKGWQVMYYPDAVAIHYGGGSTKVKPEKYHLFETKTEFQYVEKHFCRYKQVIYRVIKLFFHFIRIIGTFLEVKQSSEQNRIIRKGEVACFKWIIKEKLFSPIKKGISS